MNDDFYSRERENIPHCYSLAEPRYIYMSQVSITHRFDLLPRPLPTRTSIFLGKTGPAIAAYSSEILRSARYSLGEQPYQRRKALVKLLASEKPSK